MTDPMASPPSDHGSDRYDYIEVTAPPDIQPAGEWWEALQEVPCPDCRANVFAVFRQETAHHWPDPGSISPHWEITIAHDETCPTSEISGD